MTADAIATSTPAGCQPIDGALRIPLGLIEPSPLNPRKRWDADRVAAMGEDLKANGQIQPIRVRPNPRHTPGDGRPPFEIVVGETRWRAAPHAGLTSLDAVVAPCTDHQLIQLALAENTRRHDLHPLEEADAFDALLRKDPGTQGYASVPDLAAGVGVSASYVYQRLKLRALCPAGRDAFLAGRIDAGVALLIARMPHEKEQARATDRIVAGFGGEPYSYRQAAEYLRREFMLQLPLARFDPAATYQVAGPCANCGKRSGAEPDLFADVVAAGDMCQDSACYRAKEAEAHKQLLQAARDAGRTVLQGAKARAVLRDAGATPVDHYRLDAPCPALTDSTRPLRALLGKGFAGRIVIVDVPNAAPVELVSIDTARRGLEARGMLREQQTAAAAPPKAAPGAPDDRRAPTKAPIAQAMQAQDDNTARRQEAAAKAFQALATVALADHISSAPTLHVDGLAAACKVMLDALNAAERIILWQALGWLQPGARQPAGFEADLDWQVRRCLDAGNAGARRLGDVITLMAAVSDLTSMPINADALADDSYPMVCIAKSYGVDLHAIFERAMAAQMDATEAFVAAHAGTAT